MDGEEDDPPPPRSSARGPSTVNRGPPSTQTACASTFTLPFRNSTSPGSEESSTHPRRRTALARSAVLPTHEANTVPPTVDCCPELAGAPAEVGVADAEVPAPLAAGWVASDAEASTSETARNPRPTAAAAEPVQAAPRASVRFMGTKLQPSGLRRPQGRVENALRSAASGTPGASVGPWPSSW
ncbi:hypothetical protein [Blastococcus sp. PRF04-17]|uniref:hypothetical protein n=1 Tax=Blastococcus sp. PRF04-17 TaxID=2933797 RepID=UPI001FF600EF|nr:hypothetical protein [Blastococcus sp. PRF04-17]UOY01523.1 hypothetical protein MVA48_21770 [Blastococcus sp. PRF04-17]